MLPNKKILAICGSTRSHSVNLSLIRAIQNLVSNNCEVIVFNALEEIPNFNPDKNNDESPKTVTTFRKLIKDSDGVLICTPEYAMGVPGSLKNAINWTVSSCEFSHKPTALITASSVGEKGHASLLETLKIIECNITDETQLLISFVKTKVSLDAEITDEKTLKEVKDLVLAFEKLIGSLK